MLPRGTTLTKRGEAPKHEEIRLNDTFVAYKTKGGGVSPMHFPNELVRI